MNRIPAGKISPLFDNESRLSRAERLGVNLWMAKKAARRGNIQKA
jgi:hypothetical protein